MKTDSEKDAEVEREQGVASYEKFPSSDALSEIGEAILGGRYVNDTFKISLSPVKGQGLTCHVFAKHKDVVALLSHIHADDLDLSNYDQSLKTGGGGAEFFISATDKSKQWALLKAALSVQPSFDRHCPSKDPQNDTRIDVMGERAELAVNEAVDIILSRLRTRASLPKIWTDSRRANKRLSVNLVRDYGFLVTYILVRDVLGLKMPKRASWQYRIFSIFRWVATKGERVGFQRDIRQANELVLWIGVVFGHMFVNPGERDKVLLWASKSISKRYRKQIKASLQDPVKGSIIDRMNRSYPWIKLGDKDYELSQKEFETLVVNTVMELAGSFQYLTGSSFAAIVETIQTRFALAQAHKTSPVFSDLLDTIKASFAKEIKTDSVPSNFKAILEVLQISYAASEIYCASPLTNFNRLLRHSPRAMLDEALRHNSPTDFIFRTAARDFVYNEVPIGRGEMVCVLCQHAVMDEDVFKSPKTFHSPARATENQGHYLAFASPDFDPSPFRPSHKHHPCFGQYWARSILKAMLEGLERLPNLDVDY